MVNKCSSEAPEGFHYVCVEIVIVVVVVFAAVVVNFVVVALLVVTGHIILSCGH